jgi:uncharacterized membrane protein
MTQMQAAITWILRIGMVITLLLVTSGGVLYLSQQDHAMINYHVFPGEHVQAVSVNHILLAAGTESPKALVELGVLVLALTQLIRVACVAWFFSKMKDRKFVAISLFVLLAMIVISLGGILR